MQRHTQFIPLSQEHHHTLALCVRILRQPEANHAEDILHHYVDLLAHFNHEEQQFAPLWTKLNRPDLRQRFDNDHAQLRQMHQTAQYDHPAWNIEFAETLRNHVRFEERELFPALESLLTTVSEAE